MSELLLADEVPAPVVRLTGLTRNFTQGGITIEVLRGIDLAIAPGEIVALLGPSGSGKSTMLQAVGLLEGGFEGRIEICGQDASALAGDARTTLRREHLGFVYQFHHLLPDFTALENVLLPQLVAGVPEGPGRERAADLLGALGLAQRVDHKPSQLSGGEQQRVAVARALANRPDLVLADEPTGNLDEATADKVLAQLLELVRGQGSAALIATHNERLAMKMDRVVRLHEGQLVEGPPPRQHVDHGLPTGEDAMANTRTIADFTVKAANGQDVSLADRLGKVLLVVNTASKCGFTPQYAGLEELYKQYRDRDFEVIAFPCNQFGRQEPGSADEIAEFCSVNYGVSFPVMAKIDVNGEHADPLYAWLKSQARGLLGTRAINWNFTKFLIGRDGRVARRYGPTTKPESIATDIEEVL